MTKRLISLVLALCLMLTFAPAFADMADVQAVSEYTEAEELFMSLGIINDGTYSAGTKLTRAEYASIIARTARLVDDSNNEWQEENFGAMASGTVEPTVSAFTDVDPANEHYKAIVAVRNAGYMNGVGSNLFAPDLQLITSEAVKVVVDMLGYGDFAKANGGYPHGYISAANRLKLLTGVSVGYNQFITQSDIITILYNAMEIAVGELNGISDGYVVTKGGDDTFMKKIMGIDKTEGQLTDNGITSISGASVLKSDYMIIGGVRVKHTANSAKFREYIGREVEAYYDVTDENVNKLIHVIPTDDAVVIEAADFAGYNGGVITYYDGSRQDSINIGRNAPMIYNGARVINYTPADFNIEDGTITIIETSNAGYIAVVEDYKSMLVSMVSADNGDVYNKLNFSPIGSEIKSVNLIAGEDFEVVDIYDQSGNILSISDIKPGDVLSVMKSRNGEYVKAIVCRDVVAGATVSAFDGEYYETSNGNIALSDAFSKANNKERVEFNAAYDLYLNAFGKLVWVAAAGEKTDEKVAILLQAGNNSNGLNTSYAVRMYTSDGKLKEFTLGDKITLDGNRVQTSAATITHLNANSAKPVLYTEKDGVISSIITPAPYGADASTDNRGWYKVTHNIRFYDETSFNTAKAANDPETQIYTDFAHYKRMNFYIYSNAGNGAAYTMRTRGDNTSSDPRVSLLTHDSNTKFYKVPTNDADFDNEKLFGLSNRESWPENEYFAMDGYSRTPKDPCPEIMVQRENAKGSGNPSGQGAFLITRIKSGLNSEEEDIILLEGYDIKQGSAKKNTLKVNADAIMLNVSNVEVDSTQPAATVGPRTYRELEAGDIVRYSTNVLGEVNTMRIAFDYDTKNTFNRSNEEDTASYGGVMTISDKAIKVVANGGPALENYDYTDRTHLIATRVYPLTASSVVIIAERDSRGNLNFRTGTTADIVAYENTLVPGEYDMVASVAHWYGGFLGAVVYR